MKSVDKHSHCNSYNMMTAGDAPPPTNNLKNVRKIAAEWSRTHPNPCAPRPKRRVKR